MPKIIIPEIMDQATLTRLIHYDPITGIFTRLAGSARWKNKRAGFIHYSNHKPYRKIGFGELNKHEYYEHRLAYLYMTGEFPPHTIDHINHDGLDNRWCNLRPATIQQNIWNSRTPKTNTSGRVGVTWDTARDKWRASIRRPHCSAFLGRFDTFDEAVSARLEAERIYRVW